LKLKNLLWIDFVLGSVTGITGISFFRFFKKLLQIPDNVIVMISIITLLYSFLALFLALQKFPNLARTKALIFANWAWSLVSVILLVLYFTDASVLGKLFLILQIVVVAGLAWLEEKALKIVQTSESMPLR
jgi:hypothetical protein